MAQTIFEEMGGTYTQVGDYLLPDLKLPEEEQQPIGVWGTAPPALSEGASPGRLCDSSYKRQVKWLSCRHRPTGGGDVSSAGKAAGRGGRCHGATQGRQPNGVGRQDE